MSGTIKNMLRDALLFVLGYLWAWFNIWIWMKLER